MSRTKRRIPYWAKPDKVHLKPHETLERCEFLHGYDKLSRRVTDGKAWDTADNTTTTNIIRKIGKYDASVENDRPDEE